MKSSKKRIKLETPLSQTGVSLSVLGSRDLCRGVIAPYLDLLSLFQLARSSKRLKEVLYQHENLVAARSVSFSSDYVPSTLENAMIREMSVADWRRVLYAKRAARTGNLACFRYHVHILHSAPLHKDWFVLVTDENNNNEEDNTADLERGYQCAVFRRWLARFLERAVFRAAKHGHCRIVDEVIRLCAEVRKDQDAFNLGMLKLPIASVASFAIMGAALNGNLEHVKRLDSWSLWGLEENPIRALQSDCRVLWHVIRGGNLESAEQLGVRSLLWGAITGGGLLGAAIENSKNNTTLFDALYTDRTEKNDFQVGLDWCMSTALFYGRIEMARHILQCAKRDKISLERRSRFWLSVQERLGAFERVVAPGQFSAKREIARKVCADWLAEKMAKIVFP